MNSTNGINVTIPNGVKTIAENAFYSCRLLTSITIPSSVKTIGNQAFLDCSKLSDVYYTGSEDDWNDISIGSIHNKYLTNANIHYNYGKPLAGDVSGDGEVAVNDVIYVLKYIVGNAELTEEQIALADLSGDGNLTVLDAVLIQSLILEVA